MKQAVQGTAQLDENCDQIEGISVMQNVEEPTQVTHIENEATICGTLVSGHDGTIRSVDNMNDLRSYLARPQVLAGGSFATGTGLSYSFTVSDQSTLSTLLGSVDLNRMTGARGFRATLCFKVVVTSTPFHQGVAALSFQYATSGASAGARCNYFYQTPNIPHVKLDLAENTSAELRVPYLSHLEYFPLTGNEGATYNYGCFGLTRLSDFRFASPLIAARYTVYTWLEDVELIAARPYSTTAVLLQSGVIDQELRQSKLVSRALAATSRMASSSIGGYVLGRAAGPVSWMTNVLTKTASAFGYSKPVDETIIKRKLIMGYGGESHIDMPSSSLKVTSFQTNKLQVGKVAGNDVDEMAFDYILTRPAYIYRKVFSGTVASGDLLYNCILSPSCMWFRDNAGSGNIAFPANATLTTNALAPSHLCYLGNSFRYWRGGFKFTFKFSKSKLHGGRVVINFTPDTTFSFNAPISNNQALPSTTTLGGTDLTGYSKLFDIKDGSVVEFEVPYVSSNPYLNYYSAMGNLSVHCVCPLSTPGSASASIDMMVFVEALPGFQFAALTPSLMDGISPSQLSSIPAVYTQAGGVASDDDAAQKVMGEQFTSVKQMIMAPEVHIGADKPNATVFNFYAPYWFRKAYVSNSVPLPNNAQALFFGTRCSRILDMFSFCNGSTEVVVYHDGGAEVNTALRAGYLGNDGTASVTGSASLYNKGGALNNGVSIFEYSQDALRVCFPAFSRFQRMPTQALASQFSTATDLDQYSVNNDFLNQIGVISFRNNSGLARRMAVVRGAGDDATLGQYIGPPLTAFFQSTATVGPNPSLHLL